jgi:hypothetical protein
VIGESVNQEAGIGDQQAPLAEEVGGALRYTFIDSDVFS